MSAYKTKKLVDKRQVNVGTSSTVIFTDSTSMDGEERIIQNLDASILYVAFSGSATLGTNGELAIEQYGVLTTSFFGSIEGIRDGAPADANNTTALVV